MSRSRNIVLATILLFLVLIGGTLGYMALEGWTFLDGLYMTVITLSTVGFGEVHPVGPRGRVLTIAVIFAGIGIGGYIIGTLTQMLVEGRLLEVMGRRRLERQIGQLRDHFVICGYGRVGRIVAEEIKRSRPQAQAVIIDRDPEVATRLEEEGLPYLIGDATEEEILIKAGVQRAKGLVTALDSEADNVYITLSARSLNPDLTIIARGGSVGSERKLIRAGANRVVSPQQIGGSRMAQALLRPSVTEFLDFAVEDPQIELKMEEIPVLPGSRLTNLSLVESGIRQHFDLIIVAIKKADGTMLFNPASHTLIEPGDTLIALGNKNSLIALSDLLGNSDT